MDCTLEKSGLYLGCTHNLSGAQYFITTELFKLTKKTFIT